MASDTGNKRRYANIRVLFIVFLLLLIAISFFDEVLDLPYLLLGAEKTPINYYEIGIETGIVSVIFLGMLIVLNSILRKQKTLQDDILRELNEKRHIIKEVNHRMKNVMQLVKGILSFELRQGDGDSVPRSVLESLSAKIQAIGLFYDELGARMEGGRIEVADYSKRLVDNLVLLHVRSISVEYEFESHLVDGKIGVYYSLILSELIINTIKHAFAEEPAPSLALRGSTREGKYRVEVRNNGNTRSAVPAAKNGQGLELMGYFLDTIEGAMEVRQEGGFLVTEIVF